MNTTTTFPAGAQTSSQTAPTTRRARLTRWQGLRQNESLILLCWLGVHALLGVLCALQSVVAVAHSLLVLGIGVWFAVTGGKLERIMYAGAYLIGAEVIWRMAGASLFYEFGKYALSVILLLAIVRNSLWRGTPLALLYFILLLPSVVLPSAFTDDTELRKVVSFNMSGPFAMTLSLWLFSQVTLKREQLPRLFLALVAPAVSAASLAAFRLLTATSIYFGKSSNESASGGYGPNQVSATLGLGILAALLFILLEKRGRLINLILAVAMFGLGAQAALTFSRTGIYLAALSILVALFSLLQERKARLRLFALCAVIFVAINFLLLPRLDQFTNGALSERFRNTNSTSRDELFLADLRLWAEYPVFGVGPGLGGAKRTDLTDNAASHTEYSRVLAEHGLFGLAALFVLLGIFILNARQAKTPQQRAVVFSFLCWAALFMTVSAMRLAAPAFLIGLTAITWGAAYALPRHSARESRWASQAAAASEPPTLAAS